MAPERSRRVLEQPRHQSRFRSLQTLPRDPQPIYHSIAQSKALAPRQPRLDRSERSPPKVATNQHIGNSDLTASMGSRGYEDGVELKEGNGYADAKMKDFLDQ